MTRSRILSRLDQDIVRKAEGFKDFQPYKPEAVICLSGLLKSRVHPYPVTPSQGAQKEPYLNALRRGLPGWGCCCPPLPTQSGLEVSSAENRSSLVYRHPGRALRF